MLRARPVPSQVALNALKPAVSAMMADLDRIQWESAEQIAARQTVQLRRLTRHCAAQSPAFARRLEEAGLGTEDLLTAEGFARLPVLDRRQVQSAPDLDCRIVPQQYHPLYVNRTSGSTGEPVAIRRTILNQVAFMAMTMRLHHWHGTNFAAAHAAVRLNQPHYGRQDEWGVPVSFFYRTGPYLLLPITEDVAVLARKLARFRPALLTIYPSTLAALAHYCREAKLRLKGLSRIFTVGETLSPATRALAKSQFGAEVIDIYSSQELGYVALQCPHSGLYHSLDEVMRVEVLDDVGRPCRPGETGRVVVTDLLNFASPVIRYDIGDYAVAAEPCPCGRGLGTMARILGRERNLIRMPDGRRHWPMVGFAGFRDIAPVQQYQLIQRSGQDIEVRLVTERPLSAAEEAQLTTHIRAALGHDFALSFLYFEGRLPLGANGKFEEFLCEVRD